MNRKKKNNNLKIMRIVLHIKIMILNEGTMTFRLEVYIGPNTAEIKNTELSI